MPHVVLDADRLAKLDSAAISLGATREDLLNRAIDAFTENLAAKSDYEQWFIRKVEKSVKAADAGKLIPACEVNARSEARIARLLSGRCE